MDNTEPKRRLTTILATDVVGYSKLMAHDEEATVRSLKLFRVVIDKFIDRHEGRIFNTGGDSVLAEFGSAVEAVRCAISIQDELRVRNAELVPDRKMEFRIGINVGDVLIDGDDLLGDGINVAARLEGIAAPGGICISGSTFEQVKNKLSIGFENLGPQQVKNIPEPVAAFGITPAPISVMSEDNPTGEQIAAQAPRKNGNNKLPLILAAGAGIILILAGVVFWQSYKQNQAPATSMPTQATVNSVPSGKTRSPITFASLPENISTNEMRAGEIRVLMTGISLEGLRRDGLPFKMFFHADNTATYEFGNKGSTTREIGTWQTDDYYFCMRFKRFSHGRKVCPVFQKNGEKITAFRRDGSPKSWVLSR